MIMKKYITLLVFISFTVLLVFKLAGFDVSWCIVFLPIYVTILLLISWLIISFSIGALFYTFKKKK